MKFKIGDTVKIKGQESCPVLTIIDTKKATDKNKKIDKEIIEYTVIFYSIKDDDFKSMPIRENTLKRTI